MESEGNNHQYNEDEDTGRDNDTHKHNSDDRAKDNSNEILSILEKQNWDAYQGKHVDQEMKI